MRELFHAVYYWVNVVTWIRLIIWLVTKRNVTGKENIPRRGPLILASNHLNLADPPILTALMPRRIVWLSKQELFDIPVFGILYHLIGCIPVRRFQSDLRALRRCQETLGKGLVLGMFPEGTRSDGAGLGPGEPGTALLALRTGAPILPVAIWGTEGITLPADFLKRTAVNVAYGKPFHLPRREQLRKEDVQQASEEIMRRIAALLPPRYRGVYAERVSAPTSVGEGGRRD